MSAQTLPDQHGSIVITSVEPKQGRSASGRDWRMWVVHADGGGRFSTFDAKLGQAAFENVGRAVNISWQAKEKGNDLTGIEPADASQPIPEPMRAHTPEGRPDWDVIGLHKTRCALWAAFLSGQLAASLAPEDRVPIGRALVLAAEADIYHRDPADELADIQF